MKIYLDLVFLLNFLFDLLLISATACLLHRQIKIKRLLISALIGATSILFLFIPLNSILLFFLKIIVSIFMSLTAFGYQNLKYTWKNLSYLYSASLILGGGLYFLNMSFSYKQTGLIFYHNGLSINFIVLIISSPIIIYYYIKQARELKRTYNNYYLVDLYFKDQKITLNAYLDTGNNLCDPYFKKPIILVEKSKLNFIKQDNFFLIPYQTINNHGLLTCLKPEKVEVVGLGLFKNILVGISQDKFQIDGINCLLNNHMLGEM